MSNLFIITQNNYKRKNMIQQTLISWEAGYLPEHILVSLRKKLLSKENQQTARQHNYEKEVQQIGEKPQGKIT